MCSQALGSLSRLGALFFFVLLRARSRVAVPCITASAHCCIVAPPCVGRLRVRPFVRPCSSVCVCASVSVRPCLCVRVRIFPRCPTPFLCEGCRSPLQVAMNPVCCFAFGMHTILRVCPRASPPIWTCSQAPSARQISLPYPSDCVPMPVRLDALSARRQSLARSYAPAASRRHLPALLKRYACAKRSLSLTRLPCRGTCHGTCLGRSSSGWPGRAGMTSAGCQNALTTGSCRCGQQKPPRDCPTRFSREPA